MDTCLSRSTERSKRNVFSLLRVFVSLFLCFFVSLLFVSLFLCFLVSLFCVSLDSSISIFETIIVTNYCSLDVSSLSSSTKAIQPPHYRLVRRSDHQLQLSAFFIKDKKASSEVAYTIRPCYVKKRVIRHVALESYTLRTCDLIKYVFNHFVQSQPPMVTSYLNRFLNVRTKRECGSGSSI